MMKFKETYAVRLMDDVVEKNGLDPNLCHWVRREPVKRFADEGGENGQGLLVEGRTKLGRSSVMFKITEEEVHPSFRRFILDL